MVEGDGVRITAWSKAIGIGYLSGIGGDRRSGWGRRGLAGYLDVCPSVFLVYECTPHQGERSSPVMH